MSRTPAILALAVALSAATVGSASAFDGPQPHGPSGAAPVSAPGGGQVSAPPATTGGTVQKPIGGCNVVSGPSYLGVDCGSYKGGDLKTIKQLLGADPLPSCWDTAMTVPEQRAMGVADVRGPEGYTWYWHKCLTGIDPKTLKVQPGGAKFTYGVVSFPHSPRPGEARPVTLTTRQKVVVATQEKRGAIPEPVAALAPDATPVVNQPSAFFDGTPGQAGVSAGPVTLRARVASLVVRPTGGAETLTCPGTGLKVAPQDTPQTQPKACWYQYKAASTAEPDGRYQASITAHWTVEVSVDRGHTWQALNDFSKSAVTTVQVNEIQSLVVR